MRKETIMQTPKPKLRTVAIVAAALFAVATPIVQALTGNFAVGQSDLANDGNQTDRKSVV